MKTVYEALSFIREHAETERDKGTQFERLTRFFLKNDPLWRAGFSDVWLWGNAPTNDGADLGIDLVAQDAKDGSFWAIQCKCLDDNATLEYKDVGTFYGKTGTNEKYKHNMIVTSAARFSGNLDKIASEWDTVRLFTDDIAESEVDFAPFLEGKTSSRQVFMEPLPHQRIAIDDCLSGFAENDRGQLIMACGTGKTLTSLRLLEAYLEKQKKNGGFVLFLAPSIALVGQSMRAWANQSKLSLSVAVVCSDAKASQSDHDTWESSLKDLPYPASTDPDLLYHQMQAVNTDETLAVIFSTYQSIQVVSDAQQKGLPTFDMVICDEAHRTTGVTGIGNSKDEISEFIKVHNDEIIHAKKRLYMTATPRIYGDRAKQVARVDSYIVSSMDDADTFGPEFHHLPFGRAVSEGLLTDYKVIALTMSEKVVEDVYQISMFEEKGDFEVTEGARIIGCWKGLLDQGMSEEHAVTNQSGETDVEGKRLKNAVAFCSTIADSKYYAEHFKATVDAYIEYEKQRGVSLPEFRCKIEHVDGTMDAKERKEKLKWLEETEAGENASCRILTNARCLAEGVDVPNLDAVLFLQPKKSQIDITQAVGRVMRKFEGKEYGYIILPIVIPAGMTADEALDDNQTFAAVWDVLKALRSHDERLDARINALPYDKNDKGSVVKVTSVTDSDASASPQADDESPFKDITGDQSRLNLSDMLPAQALQERVNAMIIKKCGTKVYWDVWAKDVAQIATRHINRIGEIIREDEKAGKEFQKFLRGLRNSLNNSITEQQAVEMLSQHIITLPVFDALFNNSDFAKNNPVSIAMEEMLSVLREYTLETEAERRELHNLYVSVRLRAAGIRTDSGRQAVIKDLYEQFFRQAFPATSEKMGIVYTPNQVVDYILHATDRLLQKEFGQHLYEKNVHILDAFTGTGTFIVDLINDPELMPADRLPYKYEHEIHCNEIMLLAYYIATINIEYAYHDRMGGTEYVPFSGAVLTDTFQMYEEGDAVDATVFVENTVRVLRQKKTTVRVLIGNPPWSAGQESENDNNKNEEYPTLDRRISDTYVAKSSAALKNSLYDSYFRAFRWASDRIGEKGMISFVTNGGWLRSNSANGFRRCLVEEFNSIYVFDLRGNQRTQGETSRKEGGKVFGSGSRAPVTITMLIKNPDSSETGVIHYYDIGDYLTREEKLSIVAGSIQGEQFRWTRLHPDRFGDWLDQRDTSWYTFAPMGLEKLKNPSGLFGIWSSGLKTQRDPWAYSFSIKYLHRNMKRLIQTYNEEIKRWNDSEKAISIDDFVVSDSKTISWSTKLKQGVVKGNTIKHNSKANRTVLYRPYCKQHLYFDASLNDRQGQLPKFFPDVRSKNSQDINKSDDHSAGINDLGKLEIGNAVYMTWQQYGQTNIKNIIIDVCDRGAIVTNILPDLELVHHGQCFPLYWYEPTLDGNLLRHDAITDEALAVFRNVYPVGFTGRNKGEGGPDISKEDIFYYIYGILHSLEYRRRFEANLKKELPRIPLSENFRAFSEQGRALASLHINYETADLYPLDIHGDIDNPGPVQKMRWGKKKDKKTGKSVDDKSTLVYNVNLTFKGIPDAAHRYIVNGRSPLEWMIDRYQVKTDKASGITNDPNEYSDDPLYIPQLIQRLVTVSVKTMEILDSMLPINEMEQPIDWPEAWKTSY